MAHNPLSVKFWAMAAIAGLLVMAVSVSKIGQNSNQLKVVDMTRAIQATSMMLARSKLSKEMQLKIMERYANVLPSVIKEYAQQHGVTIISAAVLASQNKIDVTGDVMDLTIARIKHEA